MKSTKTLAVSALALALALAACQSLPARDSVAAAPEPAARVAPAPAAGPAHHDNLNAITWMQASLEYRLITGQTYRAALDQLDRALKTPDWDALTPEDRKAPLAGLPPAVIVDVDETVLDHGPYQARLVRDGGTYDEVSWDAWVREEDARPIPGALAFAQADLAVICTPVSRIAQDVVSAVELGPPGLIVTDAGSTKRAIVEDGGSAAQVRLTEAEIASSEGALAERRLERDRARVVTRRHAHRIHEQRGRQLGFVQRQRGRRLTTAFDGRFGGRWFADLFAGRQQNRVCHQTRRRVEHLANGPRRRKRRETL